MKHPVLSLVLAAATACAGAPQYIDIPPGCPQAVIDDSAEAAGDGLLVYKRLPLTSQEKAQLQQAMRLLSPEERAHFGIHDGDEAVWLNARRFAVRSAHKLDVGKLVDGLLRRQPRYLNGSGKARYVIYNERGDALPPPFYDEITFFNSPNSTLIPVRRGNLWGYIDSDGNPVVPPRYDKAGVFYDGMARVMKDGLIGYVDAEGREVITPQFREAQPFVNGYAEIKQQGTVWEYRYAYINRHGEIVSDPLYDPARYYQNIELAVVRQNGQFGYIDENGKIKIPLQYDEAYAFVGEQARVKKNGKYGFINSRGEAITPMEYDFADDFPPYKTTWYYDDGMLARVKKADKYGFIDRQGKYAVPLKYDMASAFNGNYAVVRRHDKEGLIGACGSVIFSPRYDEIALPAMMDNYIPFRQGELWGYLSYGKETIPPRYRFICF